jgi:hypothetical protein
MKRIASLSIFFAALIEFAIERARFDLWIVIIAIGPLLWNPVGRALRITREKYLVVGSKHVNDEQLRALSGCRIVSKGAVTVTHGEKQQ